MQVIEIDDLHAQPLEARLAGLRHVFGAAIDTRLAVRPTDIAELRCQHDFVAPALESAADQRLVSAGTIHVGRVDQIDAEIDGPVDGRDGFGLAGLAIDRRHAHATEADGRNLELAELPCLHRQSPQR